MKKESLSFFEAMAVLLCGTIGAGILGIPYAVNKVGWGLGMLYIILLGLLMLGLNLMLGEVALKTKQPMQLTGLAEFYLGKTSKKIMALTMLFSSFGALLAYVIGAGQILASLFGGSLFFWSIAFWMAGSVLVYFGLALVKKLDLFLSLVIVGIILLISFLSMPEIHLPHLQTISFNNLLFPIGIILFAFQSSSAILQAESLLPSKQKKLKRVIIFSSLIITFVYAFFSTAVLGVTGSSTTEVATIGLGQKMGGSFLLLVNAFSLFAMTSGFLNLSSAIKNVFLWDYKKSNLFSWAATISVPLLLFLCGFRSFIKTVDIIGSVLGCVVAVLIIMIYWRAKQKGDLSSDKFRMHHILLLSAVIIAIYLVTSIYTLIKQFV
ncbi:MAG TPA: aromatic amino acid transport family protein [Candidatus Magasanikbacteria bacterium]|nr:aromatic amino acid transport family protein [Candidatus Magasanikbacteria bacterium]